METFAGSLLSAKKHLKMADHMLTQTYPLLRDPKLFIAVLENTFLAFSSAMDAVLLFERHEKRIPPYQEDSFDSKLTALKLRVIGHAKIDLDLVATMVDLHTMIAERKRSHTEFRRKEELVICAGEFADTKSLNPPILGKHIAKAKRFIDEVSAHISIEAVVSR